MPAKVWLMQFIIRKFVMSSRQEMWEEDNQKKVL